MALTKRDYIDYANQIAIKEGIDPTIFIAQLNMESGFNPKAKNPKSGATGIGQFMPATAKGMGFVAGKDPLLDIRMAAKYMKGKLKMYNGDYRLALASYNAGSGNVAKYGGVPPFKETQNYVNSIMSMAGKGTNDRGMLTGGVSKDGTITGAAANYNVNVPDPERPNYQALLTDKNSVAIDNGQGMPQGRLSGDELMAINAITSPVQAPQDIRPNVTIGQDENGNPITVTASQYNQMLNDMDTQRMMQVNAATQAQLPEMAKTEVQLGGQNAYDTMKGLRDEYNQAIANDPRWDLVRLTPEQARLAASEIRNDYNWGGNKRGIDRAQMYQMLNALDNYQTPLNNAYDLTNQEYLAQLENMKQFQQAALTLAGNNQQLAQELMKQAQAGNKNVIDALQKTQQARIDQETAVQKQIQSDYGTMMNTQRVGMNTFYNNIPTARQGQNQYVNTYGLNRYNADLGKYNKDVDTRVKMAMPQLQADVDARDPMKRAALEIDQQNADTRARNANTQEAAVAGNLVYNSGINPQGANYATGLVPSIRDVMGNPNVNARKLIFGGVPDPKANKTINYFSLFNDD